MLRISWVDQTEKETQMSYVAETRESLRDAVDNLARLIKDGPGAQTFTSNVTVRQTELGDMIATVTQKTSLTFRGNERYQG
jgi:hypothetical protein